MSNPSNQRQRLARRSVGSRCRVAGFALAALLCGASAAAAQTPLQLQPQLLGSDPLKALPPEEARRVLQWAADWVQPMLPNAYHNDKDWGKQQRVYAGVKFVRRDGRLSTRRRWKELNQGRWFRYSINLRDPTDPDRLAIRVLDAHQDEDQRVRFQTQIDTLLDLKLEQERWNLGTRLISVSVDAEVKLRMKVAGDVGFEFDLTRIPPDVLADPRITATELKLVDLRIRRISKVGGEVAEVVGDLAKRVIREEYLPRQQAKITAKLNAQIDRRRDRLRIGAGDWLTHALSEPGGE